MFKIKNICYTSLAIIVFASCTKVTNDDISFVKTGIAPTNFLVDVTVTKAGIATITPTAIGVASFDVYFGDNSVNASIAPGKNVIHTYTDGTFTIKVVAKNLTGDSAILSKSITVTTSQVLVDFETPATTYSAGGFGGGNFDKLANPSPTGINTSANVGRMTNGSATSPSLTYAGMTINVSSPFLFTSKGIMKMKVYANHVGATFKFKLEGPSSGATTETDVATTIANGWEELTFVMDPSVIGRSFTGFSLFYEFGKVGNGSANYVALFDDIKIFP